jgi:hypothetical protein
VSDQDIGTVVDLRTRSTYRPDYASLARHRIITARRALDLSHDEFAVMLAPHVGWPVTGETVRSWETDAVPPGDVLLAASTVSPSSSHRLGVRSHKFIATHLPAASTATLIGDRWPVAGAPVTTPIAHPSGDCRLHVWPFGSAIYHLVEDLELPDIAGLALWRYRSYEENLVWAADQLRTTTGDTSVTASYVLSLYWVHTPIWAGRVLDTALRIMCAPRVLLEREVTDVAQTQSTAAQAERGLLAEGFEPDDLRGFGVKGVSCGYASWSGVVYHPMHPPRSLAEDEIVSCELAVQSLWVYCEHINRQIEQGLEPDVDPVYGWRFLRGARSRLLHPRPQETGAHRSMREAIVTTSGLPGLLGQAIEVLREAG